MVPRQTRQVLHPERRPELLGEDFRVPDTNPEGHQSPHVPEKRQLNLLLELVEVLALVDDVS